MAIMNNVKLYWPKIVGEPTPKYNPEDGREWAVDLCFDDKQVSELQEQGVTTSFYVKNKDDERGNHFTYRRNEFRKDGVPSKPIKIVDEEGKDWPKDKLIGNGTVANIRYALNEVTARPKNRVKISVIEIQIVELKEYEAKAKETFTFKKAEAKVSEEKWVEA